MGESYDIRTAGYEINHGKMGMTKVYETAPGSGQYFIVDRIGGEGLGGNGREVIAESIEYGLLNLIQNSVQGNSWHSWHVSPNNLLVRANQKVSDNLVEELTICGCGPGGYEVDMKSVVAGDATPPIYTIAIFMLPGSDLPQLGDPEEFEAEFERTYYKKIYVPRAGKECREHLAVC